MIYMENKGFRIASITRFCLNKGKPGFETAGVKDGLGIEKIDEDGHAYVIAFVKPDKDGDAKVEMVGTRFFDYVEPDIYQAVRMMFQAAVKMVDAANYKGEYDL